MSGSEAAPSALSRPEPELRAVTPDDAPALAMALATFPWEGLSDRPWPERIRHWWEGNPACAEGWERGWVLDADEKIVGFLGSVPRRVHLDGEPALSANATTWWVDPSHRASSLRLLAQFTAQRACGHFNTTAAGDTHPVLAAFGFRPLPALQGGLESVLVVDPASTVAARLSGPEAGAVGRSTSWGLRRALGGAGRAVQRMRLPRVPASYDVEVLAAADDRFAALDDALRRRYGFTAQRDPASIDWFLAGEFAEHKALVACRQGDQLLGYALLLERASGSSAHLPILDCLDLVRRHDEPAILAVLVRGMAEVARRRSAAAVVLRHFDPFIAEQSRRFGLTQRDGPPRREFVKLPAGVGNADHYLTQFHGDFAV